MPSSPFVGIDCTNCSKYIFDDKDYALTVENNASQTLRKVYERTETKTFTFKNIIPITYSVLDMNFEAYPVIKIAAVNRENGYHYILDYNSDTN